MLANDRISISVDRGEVLGLLGENGAGKTTLMNILSGLVQARTPARSSSTGRAGRSVIRAEAIQAGIGMVHQHFHAGPGLRRRRGGRARRGERHPDRSARSIGRSPVRRVVELSEQYGLNVDPDATIEDLPVGVRQRVEILKALYRESDILVLDEPSAPC